MLLKYIVNNFKSIGRSVEFSMMPSSENIDEKFLTKLHTKHGDIDVLRRGAFFGPNASGKTTFIESIYFARNYIVESQKSEKRTGVPQFKGDIDDLHGMSLFQFVFYLDENIYEYGFSLTVDRVAEEWLMIHTNKGFVPMFTRATNSEGITDIDIESKFAAKNSSDRQLAEILKRSINEKQKNQLFLYKLKENGIKKAEKIVDWFKQIQPIFPQSKIKALPIRIKRDEDFRDFLSNSLRALDTGVNNISAAHKEIDLEEFAEKLNLKKELIEDIESKKNGVINLGGKYYIFFEKDNTTSIWQLEFEHKLNNKTTNFNIEDESDGTQRLLDLLPILFRISKGGCGIYFIDELDRSLHTKLSKYILKYFIENSQSPLSQIIFTVHDVNLINLDEFSKDEIWFIEKRNSGETFLRPFSDFETRENQDIIKDYLNGRFGAVPVIRGE